MPSKQVDGMNVEAVHESSNGSCCPYQGWSWAYFLEILTYRYKGHSVSDPANYRSKDELHQYMEQDPISTLERKNSKSGNWF
jgi:pyruvate dehydrogenase E1 component alpha subunit